MRRWVVVAVLLVAAVAAAQAIARARRPRSAGLTGREAPDFTLASLDGGRTKLSSLRGRVVVVNFWATWCSPCKAEIPDFVAVYAARRAQCVEFLGVAEESAREDVAAAARELRINYPVLLDDDGAVGERFEVPAYPRTYLVDARGKVRVVFAGIVARSALEEALAPLLAETGAGCPRQG